MMNSEIQWNAIGFQRRSTEVPINLAKQLARLLNDAGRFQPQSR